MTHGLEVVDVPKRSAITDTNDVVNNVGGGHPPIVETLIA